MTEKSAKSEISQEIVINPDIKAPIKTGDILGQVEIIKDGQIVSSTDLTAITNVPVITIPQAIAKTLNSIIAMG